MLKLFSVWLGQDNYSAWLNASYGIIYFILGLIMFHYPSTAAVIGFYGAGLQALVHFIRGAKTARVPIVSCPNELLKLSDIDENYILSSGNSATRC